MSIFSSIGSFLSGSFVKDLGDAIDKNVTNDEERMALKNEAQRLSNEAVSGITKLVGDLEAQATERWKADMASNEPLAKKIRPWSVIVSGGNLMAWMVAEASFLAFGLPPLPPAIMETSFWAFATAFGLYAPVRGAEKITALIKGH